MSMHKQPNLSQSAFTLIELSIVLVIIGLIVGGVLMGRDLIESAKARGYMSQLDQYETAATTFRLKYNCQPGDCRTAAQMGLGVNGNGDEILNGSSRIGDSVGTDYTRAEGPPPPAQYASYFRAYGEAQQFWVHLSNARLIKENLITLTMADGDPTYTGDELAQYLPKLNNSNGYLTAFSWGGRTFFRNGITSIVTPFSKPSHEDTSVKGMHVLYMTKKLGYDDIMLDTGYAACTVHYCGYPEALSAGRKMIPVQMINSSILYRAPTYPVSSTACVTNNAGVISYNLNNVCHFLWKIR